jgi:hypothetical protein
LAYSDTLRFFYLSAADRDHKVTSSFLAIKAEPSRVSPPST